MNIYGIKYKKPEGRTFLFTQLNGGECFKLVGGTSIYIKLTCKVGNFNSVNILSGVPVEITLEYVIPVKATLIEDEE